MANERYEERFSTKEKLEARIEPQLKYMQEGRRVNVYRAKLVLLRVKRTKKTSTRN